jgi:hypothetical protein
VQHAAALAAKLVQGAATADSSLEATRVAIMDDVRVAGLATSLATNRKGRVIAERLRQSPETTGVCV